MKRPVPNWLLALGAFALFAPSLAGGLTNWDDPDYVTNNWLAAAGWRGVLDAFSFTFDGAYYPLTQATYSVVHALGGGASALHWLQVILFALTVVLVPLALEPFGVRREVGLWAAVLWAVHPFRPESVSWAANLKDTLGALLVVAAFALFPRRLVWSLVALAAALLSKSAFFGLALLFPLIDRRRGWPHALLGLATAVLAGRLHLAGKVASGATSSLAERVATGAWTPWWYLGRIIFPAGSRALYDFGPVQPTDVRCFVAVGAWALLAVAVWRWRRLLLPVAAYVLALAPVSGLVPLRHLVADRYTLFPSLALFAAIAVAAIERFPRHAARALAVAAVVLVPTSVLRQREWHDGRSLWEANVRLEPAVPAVRMNLAEAYGAEQRWEAARTQTLELWKLRPEDPRVLVQAVWLSGKVDGATDEVLEARQQALLGGALSADAVVSVAEDCLAANHLNSADTLLRHAPSVKSDTRALRIGSVVARRQRRAADAIALAQQALSAGDERARVELAFALVDGGRVEEALRLVEAPMPDARGQALLRGAKAYALQRAGRLDEARAENDAALEQLRALPP